MIEFTGKDSIHVDIQYRHDEPRFTTEEVCDRCDAVKRCPNVPIGTRTRPLLRFFDIQAWTVIKLALVEQYVFSCQRITPIRKRIRPQHEKHPESPTHKPSDMGPQLRLLSTLLEADTSRASLRGVRNVPGES